MKCKYVCLLMSMLLALLAAGQVSAFFDDFEGPGHVAGQPDPDWTVLAGDWLITDDGQYASTPAEMWKYSIVDNFSFDAAYGYISVDCVFGNGGPLIRFKDTSNWTFVNLYAAGFLTLPTWEFVWGSWEGGTRNPVDGDWMHVEAWITPTGATTRIEDLDTGAVANTSMVFNSGQEHWTQVGLFSYTVPLWDNFNAVPEPGAFGVLSASLIGLIGLVKRRRSS